MRKAAALSILILLSAALNVFAEIRCIDSEGEAVIVNNDTPSAKIEAISRAKWSAIEQVAGVDVKAQSVVQNLMLVDEAIKREIKGAVSKYNVISAKTSNDGTLLVRINACVESAKAMNAVGGLALNNALSVFILASDVASTGAGNYQDTNLLSETLIGRLADLGYTVVDVAPTHAVDKMVIDSAIKSGKYAKLRPLMYKFLTNVLLIGKVDYTVSVKKGEDIGYGISMPFNNVTARLTYRLVTKDASGNMVILAAGTEQGKGLANNVEDAAAESLKDVTEKLTPVVLDKVGKHVKGVTKKVEVKVSNITQLSDNFAAKEVLQNIAWVTNVEDKGMGEFYVSYPENTIYLANSLSQKGNFKVVSFTSHLIELNYAK